MSVLDTAFFSDAVVEFDALASAEGVAVMFDGLEACPARLRHERLAVQPCEVTVSAQFLAARFEE